jgi:hypothetical protein
LSEELVTMAIASAKLLTKRTVDQVLEERRVNNKNPAPMLGGICEVVFLNTCRIQTKSKELDNKAHHASMT